MSAAQTVIRAPRPRIEQPIGGLRQNKETRRGGSDLDTAVAFALPTMAPPEAAHMPLPPPGAGGGATPPGVTELDRMLVPMDVVLFFF